MFQFLIKYLIFTKTGNYNDTFLIILFSEKLATIALV